MGTPLLAVFGSIVSCSPVDISVFTGTEPDDSPPPTIIIDGVGANGGASHIGEGGAGSVELLHIDHFDDGNTKGEDPAGWWYQVNDGTGIQHMSLVPAEEGPPDGSVGGFVLRVEAEGSTKWGSAFGIDVAGFDLGTGAASLAFRIAADVPVEVDFHAIDGTGAHFTRIIPVTTTWSLTEIRLDQMFIVGGETVRRFDVKTADEFQWFRFDGEANAIWIDDVTLRSYPSTDVR